MFPKQYFPNVTCIYDDEFARTELEKRYFKKSYWDPNTQKFYTCRALLSQFEAPLPRRLDEFKTPVMFLIPANDTVLMPASYIRRLQGRLPANIKKKIITVNGGHWWMHSSPEEAAKILCDWFDKTIKR